MRMLQKTLFFWILWCSWACFAWCETPSADRFAEYKEILKGESASPAISFDTPMMDFQTSTSQAKLDVDASFVPPVDEQPGILMISVKIPHPWYIYSMTQKAGGPFRTLLHFPKPEKIQPVGTITATPTPQIKLDPDLWDDLAIETHAGQVTWKIPFRWSDPAQIVTEISGSVEAQMCDPNTCMEPEKFTFTARPTASFPGNVSAEITAPIKVPAVEEKTIEENANGENDKNATQKMPVSYASLWMWLAMAYCGGLILNLMPCVLPVIGPKIYSFVHQSGESRWRIFQLNISYTFGLLSVLWILAAFSRLGDLLPWIAAWLPESLASQLPMTDNLAWGEHFTYPGFVIFMIALVFTMGLSFLGVWEIPIPGFMAGGKLGEMQRKEGLLGAFCMGILTTILATPCVGPFLGPVFGAMMSQPVAISFLVFTVIGLGLATPYLLVGIFPSWVKFLPKPGAWMETLKEVMGFFFLAVVVWLFYNLPHEYVVPTLAFLVALWFACWLVGKVSFSGGSRESVLTAWGVGFLVVLGVGVGMFQLWFGQSSIREEHQIAWQEFSVERVETWKSEKKIVFIDFTANWCMTCKTNSLFAIETENVGEFLSRHPQIVPVLADWTERSPEIKEYIRAMKRNSIPLIVIWIPGEEQPRLLDGLISESLLLETLEDALQQVEKLD